jgi:hypothetical protein
MICILVSGQCFSLRGRSYAKNKRTLYNTRSTEAGAAGLFVSLSVAAVSVFPRTQTVKPFLIQMSGYRLSILCTAVRSPSVEENGFDWVDAGSSIRASLGADVAVASVRQRAFASTAGISYVRSCGGNPVMRWVSVRVFKSNKHFLY